MTEKEAQSRLERLLKRPRTDAKTAQVRSIAAQPGEAADKVIKIELLDQLPANSPNFPLPRGPLLRPDKKAATPVEVLSVSSPPTPVASQRDRVAQSRAILGNPMKRGRLWSYLTKEYRPMLRFGVDSGTLRRGILPFTLRLSPVAATLASHALAEQITPLLKPTLALVLKKGWTFLSIPEYNLLAALASLNTLAAVPWEGPVPQTLLAALLVFHALPDAPQRTLEAWERATQTLGVNEQVRVSGASSIRTLLASGPDKNSLPDLVRALLMLQNRRCVSWSELQPPPQGLYFASDSFDCTAEVQQQIDKAVETLRTQRDSLDRDLLEIRRIRFYLPEGPLLDEFTKAQDRADVAEWCHNFLARVQTAVTPLLGGQVVLAGGGAATLFQDPTLTSSLSRLQALHGQKPKRPSEWPEWQASVAKVVMNLGKVLVVLIRTRSVSADPLARSEEPGEGAEPLPHEQDFLVGPSAWAGLTVVDALIRCAQVCLLAGRFLGETSLDATLARESELQARAAKVDAELLRLVPDDGH